MARILSADDRSALLDAARNATEHAYVPHSGFKVGAAVLTGTGCLYTGCNVENFSYRLTTCAEQAAITRAVSEEGGDSLTIRSIAIVASRETPCSPCGACRQMIFEFGSDAVVLFKTIDGWKECSIRDLLPDAFRFVPSE
jgi:cytidine deaminase